MKSTTKKNLSISIVILIVLYLFLFFQAYFLNKKEYIFDYIFYSLGGFIIQIAIPLIVAFIAKLAFKKHFLGMFWKALLLIAIPISLISAYGNYQENAQKEIHPSPVKNIPRKYEPKPAELKKYETKVRSQTFYTMDQINDAIKKYPTSAVNYYNRGMLYSSELNHTKAIEDYTRAINLDPYLSVAYLNRSVEYLFLNELDKALSDSSKAIQLNPNLSEAFFSRAKIKALLGKETESKEDMKKAARLGNSDAIEILMKHKINWEETQ